MLGFITVYNCGLCVMDNLHEVPCHLEPVARTCEKVSGKDSCGSVAFIAMSRFSCASSQGISPHYNVYNIVCIYSTIVRVCMGMYLLLGQS